MGSAEQVSLQQQESLQALGSPRLQGHLLLLCLHSLPPGCMAVVTKGLENQLYF